MKKSKTFFALILLIAFFGLAKFFDFGVSSVRNFGSASLVLTENISPVMAGEFSYEEGGDNTVISKTEVLSDAVLSDVSLSETSFGNTGENSACRLSSGIRYYLARFSDGGDVWASYGAQSRWPVASISKLMSAVVAVENVDLKKSIELTADIIETEGSAGDFKEGDLFLAEDLLAAALLASSNDAIEALAGGLGRDNFIRIMNEKAKELRMSDTFFADPTGLSIKNQSSANDIYRLMNYILAWRPEILEMTQLKYVDIKNINTGKKRRVANINEFAGRADFVGGKTGFIPQSGGNLVSVFDRGGQKLIIVVFDSADRFGATKEILDCLN